MASLLSYLAWTQLVPIEDIIAGLQGYAETLETRMTLQLCARYGKGEGSGCHIRRLPTEIIDAISDCILKLAQEDAQKVWSTRQRCYNARSSHHKKEISGHLSPEKVYELYHTMCDHFPGKHLPDGAYRRYIHEYQCARSPDDNGCRVDCPNRKRTEEADGIVYARVKHAYDRMLQNYDRRPQTNHRMIRDPLLQQIDQDIFSACTQQSGEFEFELERFRLWHPGKLPETLLRHFGLQARPIEMIPGRGNASRLTDIWGKKPLVTFLSSPLNEPPIIFKTQWHDKKFDSADKWGYMDWAGIALPLSDAAPPEQKVKQFKRAMQLLGLKRATSTSPKLRLLLVSGGYNGHEDDPIEFTIEC